MRVFADVGQLEVANSGMVHNRFDTWIIFEAGIYMAQKHLFVHLSLHVRGGGGKSQLRRYKNYTQFQTDLERLVNYALMLLLTGSS